MVSKNIVGCTIAKHNAPKGIANDGEPDGLARQDRGDYLGFASADLYFSNIL
jgi:hypothetical protein